MHGGVPLRLVSSGPELPQARLTRGVPYVYGTPLNCVRAVFGNRRC